MHSFFPKIICKLYWSNLYDFSTMHLYKYIISHLRRHLRRASVLGLLPGASSCVCPDKRLVRRRHQHQVLATWTQSVLLQVTKVPLENRFSWINEPLWEWQEQCIEFTSYPGAVVPDTACAPAGACPGAWAPTSPLALLHSLLPPGNCQTCCPEVMALQIATELAVILISSRYVYHQIYWKLAVTAEKFKKRESSMLTDP